MKNLPMKKTSEIFTHELSGSRETRPHAELVRHIDVDKQQRGVVEIRHRISKISIRFIGEHFRVCLRFVGHLHK